MGRTEVFRRGGRRPGDEGLDDQLLSRIANGDEAAWPLIVDRHLAPIVSFAWYNLGDRAAAEDVAQECFVRLFRKVPDWQPGGAKLSTWLYRVATNLCIDRRRADRFEPLDLAQGRSGVAEIARELDMSLTLDARCEV